MKHDVSTVGIEQLARLARDAGVAVQQEVLEEGWGEINNNKSFGKLAAESSYGTAMIADLDVF